MNMRAYRLAISLAALYLLFGFGVYLVSQPTDVGSELLLGNDANGGTIIAIWIASGAFAALAWALPKATRLPDGSSFVSPFLLPAVVGPIALYPVAAIPSSVGLVAVAVLWPLSLLPLGLDVSRLARPRAWLIAVTGSAAAVAIVIGLIPLVRDTDRVSLLALRFVAVASISLLPGVALVARSGDATIGSAASATDRVLARASVAIECLAPVVAGTFLVLPWDLAVILGAAALLGIAVAIRIAVRPLASVAARANTQRDLAVAVTEAERSRLAADLHDGPLQDILLLARRLEAEGDSESATLAREIGVDLRDLSADLRLPMLDDLGVGPALEWLVGRARRLSGLDVSLRYETLGRPPQDVELAAFRIAQEAIANAIRHGRPPVAVRCATSGVALSMSIDDSGARLVGPELRSRTSGQFGLLNMQQRAEQVGARLDVRKVHGGGTTVALEWQATVT